MRAPSLENPAFVGEDHGRDDLESIRPPGGVMKAGR